MFIDLEFGQAITMQPHFPSAVLGILNREGASVGVTSYPKPFKP
jgi:hypothetical protein